MLARHGQRYPRPDRFRPRNSRSRLIHQAEVATAGYRAITNEIRFEIARQLLQDTQASLAQIAAALGYSEASAFTRAFRRWSGRTPTAWRTEGRHG
jgi:AraC-like DNA-binding protein